MSVLLYIGIMLLCGLLFGRLTKLIGLPNVTGYLIAGLIFGPHVLGVFSLDTVNSINAIVSEIALAFIALFIGAEFKISFLKEIGVASIVITLFQGILAGVLVTLGLIAFKVDLALALVFGTIATATAPAVTIMIIKQYRAHGPVTKMLLSVVALDDALALILFFFAINVAKSMTTGAFDLYAAIVKPLISIGISALIGVGAALILLIPLRFFKKKSNRMCAIAGTIFIASALSNYFDASSLMTCMIFGGVLVNISKEADSVIELSELMTPIILMLFFVLSGASLDIRVIPMVGLIGIIYIVTRATGKMFGSWLGAVVMKSPPTVKKYLGLTLLPQAGVALGLMIVASQALPHYAEQIRTVILGSVLFYELVGSALSKIALSKAGEIPDLPIKKKKVKRA